MLSAYSAPEGLPAFISLSRLSSKCASSGSSKPTSARNSTEGAACWTNSETKPGEMLREITSKGSVQPTENGNSAGMKSSKPGVADTGRRGPGQTNDSFVWFRCTATECQVR